MLKELLSAFERLSPTIGVIIEKEELSVTISIGVGMMQEESEGDIDGLLKTADKAL